MSASSDDGLLQAIEAIEHADKDIRAALDDARRTFDEARTARIEGTPLPQLAERALTREGRETRRRAAIAIADYEHAMMVFRATIIRELVDDHGLTFAEIARRMRVSRQMVSRLYRSS